MSATLDRIKEEMNARRRLQEAHGLTESLLSGSASPAEPLDCAPEWRRLAEHGSKYAGQWVALGGDRLLAHGEAARKVYTATRESGIRLPPVVRVNPSDQLPSGGW